MKDSPLCISTNLIKTLYDKVYKNILTFSIFHFIIIHNQPIFPVILIGQIELLVDIDDLFGIVTDDVGREDNLVLAPHDCFVFFLRSYNDGQ